MVGYGRVEQREMKLEHTFYISFYHSCTSELKFSSRVQSHHHGDEEPDEELTLKKKLRVHM